MNRLIFNLLILILIFSTGINLFAQYLVRTSVQTTAGGTAQSNNHSLAASVGQLSPPDITTSGQHSLYGGFIYTLGYESLSIIATSGTANVNESLQIVAEIAPWQNVAQATIYFREGGEQNFTSQAMRLENASYVYDIPGNKISDCGIEYYIMAIDIDGNSASAPASGVNALPVNVAEPGALNPTPQPGGSEQTAYRLVSFPLELSDKSPAAVLSDDLESYNKNQWRLFELRADQKYYEFSDIANIKPGQGFWLIVKSGGKMLDTGAGKTIITNKKYAIALIPGWTFVGNPFNFSIPINKLSLKSNQTLEIRNYEGAWEKQVTDSYIQPFEGYAVANNKTSVDTLYIDPYLYPVSDKFDKVLAWGQDTDFKWSININAQCQEAKDCDNIIAIAEDASIDWDELDRAEPPVIGEYVSVSFPHQDWDKPLKSYCTDVRPEPLAGEIWQFEVKSNISDPVILNFEGLDDVPLQYEVWLIDEIAKISQNVRDNKCYSIAVSSEAHPRQLKLLVGSHDFIGEQVSEFQVTPEKYELFQNFPNPFNPTTTIRYGLPVTEKVTLKIYNLLGKEVVTLVNNELQQAGYHVAIWDGKNQQGQVVANGIYMYQLRVGRFSVTNKMAMMK